jgi:hypothetical protein
MSDPNSGAFTSPIYFDRVVITSANSTNVFSAVATSQPPTDES